MPKYTYRKKEDFNDDMNVEIPCEVYYGSYDTYQTFLKENVHFENHIQVVPNGRSSIDPVIAGRQKSNREFNDVLIEMKKKVGPGNTIKTYY